MIEHVMAQPLFAEHMFRFERLESSWGTIFAIIGLLLTVAVVWGLYRGMDREITRRNRIILTGLRIMVVLALFVYYLCPVPLQWRDRSRIAVLCDTSGSMGIDDLGALPTDMSAKTRLDLARSFLFADVDPVQPLRHDLSCYAFDSVPGLPTLIASTNPARYDQLNQWLSQLRVQGNETGLTDSIISVLDRRENLDLTAIVLLSDGCNNIGASADVLLKRLKAASCPVHVVAVGKSMPPFEMRIEELRAPDSNALQAEIPALVSLVSQGRPGRQKTVKREHALELFMLPRKSLNSDLTADNINRVIRNATPTHTVPFYSDTAGRLVRTVPAEEQDPAPMTETMESRLALPAHFMPTRGGDFVLVAALNRDTPDDAYRSVAFREITIHERKDSILIIAGGPVRDFQFIESRMKRTTKSVTDVWLAFAKRFYRTGPTPRDKVETNELENGRLTPKFLSQYDTIIAFDLDWKNAMTSNDMDCLERWVAREGGGLIVTAGPVFAGEPIDGWTQSAVTKIVRDLYPVQFFGRGEGRFYETGMKPRRVRLAGSGDALFPMEGGDDSFRWSDFPGFYGIMPVKSVKPAATVWAVMEPGTKSDDENNANVLFASQWYGAGRVFYIGNSELWRLRTFDEKALDRFIGRVINYVSEGRRERSSPYGRILLDRDEYEPGMNVSVQAIVNDRSFQPMTLEKITLEIVPHRGNRFTRELNAHPGMPGVYQGDFIVSERGNWRLELPIPGTGELLTQTLSVKENDRERPPAYCNESLLREIAQASGGTYQTSTPTIAGHGMTLLNSIPVKSREPVINEELQFVVRTALLLFICVALLVEWLIRRMTGLV